MTLSELADTLIENLRHKLQALPEPKQFCVVAEFNKLFLDCLQRSDVQLDHEDILKLRTDKIASALPDIIHSEAQHDTTFLLPQKDCGGLLFDLALLEKPEQEAIRVAWSALSESQQQDVALEVDKQFQSHLSKIRFPLSVADELALHSEWVPSHIYDIIQASHVSKDTSTRGFPFAATLWPQTLADAYRKIWQTLSNAQRDNVLDMVKVSFQEYTAELSLSDDQDAPDLYLWESWGTRGFKDATDAVKKGDSHKGIYVHH